MVYGRHSKGNFVRLSRLARELPVFPDYDNKRSMIYIKNLCEFVKLVIDNYESGLFFLKIVSMLKQAKWLVVLLRLTTNALD